MWNYCQYCGKRIEVGEMCYGLPNGESVCVDCCVPENGPVADAVPVVHGHFERAEREVSGAVVLRGWECSVCKRFTRSNFVGSWNYCPNCGAKMDRGDLDGQRAD